jgi:hypothetical protein
MTTNQTDYLKSIGAADNCIELDGVDGYGLSIDFGVDKLVDEIEFYAYTATEITGSSSPGWILGTYTEQSVPFRGLIFGNFGGALTNQVFSIGNDRRRTASNESISAGTHFYKVVWNDSITDYEIYIDGNKKTTINDGGTAVKLNARQFWLGCRSAIANFFEGKVFGLKITSGEDVYDYPIAEGKNSTSYGKDDQTKQITWNGGYEWKEQNEYFPNFIDGYTEGVNLLSYSSALSNWGANGLTIVGNKITSTGAVATPNILSEIYEYDSLITGTEFTGSVILHTDAGQPTDARILIMYFSANSFLASIIEDITLTTTPTRYSNTHTCVEATATRVAFRVDFGSSSSTGDYMYVSDAQLEESGFSTVYQLTDSSPTAGVNLPYSIVGIPLSFDTGVSLPQFFKNLGVSSINESSNTQYDFYKDISYIDGSRTHGQYAFYKKASSSRYEYFKNWKNETEFYANIDVDVIHDFYTFYKNAATILKDTADFCNIDALRVGNTYNVADYPYLWYNTSAFSTYKDDTFRIANDNAILLDGIDGGGTLQTPVTFTEEFYIEEYLKIDDTTSAGHVYANSNGDGIIFYGNERFGFNFNTGSPFYTNDIIEEGVISLFRFRFYIDGGVVKLEVSKDGIVVSTTTTTLTAIDFTLDAFGLKRGAGTSVGYFEGTRFGLDLNGTKFNLAEGEGNKSFERGNSENQIDWEGGYSWVSQDRFVPNRTEGYSAGPYFNGVDGKVVFDAWDLRNSTFRMKFIYDENAPEAQIISLHDNSNSVRILNATVNSTVTDNNDFIIQIRDFSQNNIATAAWNGLVTGEVYELIVTLNSTAADFTTKTLNGVTSTSSSGNSRVRDGQTDDTFYLGIRDIGGFEFNGTIFSCEAAGLHKWVGQSNWIDSIGNNDGVVTNVNIAKLPFVVEDSNILPTGVNLLTNGDFETNINGWTPRRDCIATWVDGKLRTTNGAINEAGVDQEITCVIGQSYTITQTVSSLSGLSRCWMRVATANMASQATFLLNVSTNIGTGTFTGTFTATQETLYVYLQNFSGVTGDYAEWDNISVPELVPNYSNLPTACTDFGTQAEYDAITTISLIGESLSTDFTSAFFEKFRNLSVLELSSNQNITIIDTKDTTTLVTLKINDTNVTLCDVSKNPNLEEVIIYQSNIAILDLTENPLVNKIFAYNTELSDLDISNNPLIIDLRLHNCNVNAANNSELLIQLDAFALSNGFFRSTISGGGSLTTAGQTAKTNLLGKGWTINI